MTFFHVLWYELNKLIRNGTKADWYTCGMACASVYMASDLRKYCVVCTGYVCIEHL